MEFFSFSKVFAAFMTKHCDGCFAKSDNIMSSSASVASVSFGLLRSAVSAGLPVCPDASEVQQWKEPRTRMKKAMKKIGRNQRAMKKGVVPKGGKRPASKVMKRIVKKPATMHR